MFQVEIKSDRIYITNISNKNLNRCFVDIKDFFFKTIVSSVQDFPPYLTRWWSIPVDNFYEVKKDKKYEVNIYQNHSLIFKKNINDKSKCFVLVSNQKHEALSEQLIVGLSRYSNCDILHYTSGYDCSLQYKGLINIRKDIDGDSNNPLHMQFSKALAFVDAIDKGYKNLVYIDGDVVVRSNVEKVFEYFLDIDSPILQKSAFDFTSVNGKYIPGPLVSKYMDIDSQPFPYFWTNIVLFTPQHRQLFIEWHNCFTPELEDISKQEFLHDELIFNCLLWKKNIIPKIDYFTPVINGGEPERFLEIFYNHNEYNDYIDMSKFGLGYEHHSMIPYDKSKVIGFHGIKDPEVAKVFNELIYNNEFYTKKL